MPDSTSFPTFERQLEMMAVSLRHAVTSRCLLIAATSDPATEGEVAAELRRRLDGELAFLDFTFSPEHFSLTHYLAALPAPQRASVVSAHGLDDLTARLRAQALEALNLGRETLRHVGYSVVLWVRPATLGELQFKAGDFYAWRSGTFLFDRALATVAPDRTVPPQEAARLRAQAESYRQQLAAAGLPPDLKARLGRDLIHLERELSVFDLHQAAGGEGALPASQAELYQSYLTYLRNAYRWLGFEGIRQTRKTVLLPLDEIYTPLRATHSGGWDPKLERALTETEMRRLMTTRERPSEREELERAGRREVKEALARQRRIVVLGDPGAGKSTFLKYVALMCALGPGAVQDKLGLDQAPLPIIVPLAAYAEGLAREPRLSLADFLPRYFAARGMPGLSRLFEGALAAGQALILLDGLDEVTVRADRRQVAERVAAFLQEWDQNRAVVTSRIVGYHEAPLPGQMPHFTLSPFSPEEIRLFAHQWCLAYELQAGDTPQARQRAQGEAEQLIRAIEARPHIQELAGNPLLLTIIALIQRQGVKLPDHRVELYENMVTTLAETWCQARALEPGRVVGEPISQAEAVAILGPLALWMHGRYPGGAAPGTEIEARLVEQLVERGESPQVARTTAQEFLELVRRQTGLLMERGQGVYGFLHLTFEEYLAARGFALLGQEVLQDTVDALLLHLYDPAWHEVILLAVGHFAISEGKRRAASRLVEAMLEAPAQAEQQGQNVVLAGRCLRDVGKRGLLRPTWEKVIERLVETMQGLEVPVRTRAEAGEVLDELGWLPPDLNDWIPIPNTQSVFYMAKYPVTNSQYARFIEAGGYEKSVYWPEETGARGWWEKEGREQGQPWSWDDPRFGRNRRGYPVVDVTWYEALAYCHWLTELLHRTEKGETLLEGEYELIAGLPSAGDKGKGRWELTLPGEAEWLQAAGGEGGGRYPWDGEGESAGRLPEDEQLRAILARANVKESDLGGTTPVAMYPAGASPYGVMDMAGNVWEWTRDPWEEASPYKALRGGSRWSGYKSARVGSRSAGPPGILVFFGHGFRVCARCSPPESS